VLRPSSGDLIFVRRPLHADRFSPADSGRPTDWVDWHSS